MRLVADANVHLAVALNEPEKQGIIELTRGRTLASPEALPFEIGNALSNLIRRGRLSLQEAQAAWQACSAITVELRGVDVDAALELAAKHGIYAYSEARQKLSEVLDVVRRPGPDSPFDIPGVKTKATTEDILQAIRESRSPRRFAKS